MNIDLLLGRHGQSGLLCSRVFKQNPMGAIFDARAREIILEFDEGRDPLHLNITVEERFAEKLLLDHALHVAALENGQIAEALEVPLLYLNDPYGGKFNERPLITTHRAVIAVEQFLKRCSFAQPIHRDDLGDETTLSGITGGDVRSLSFSPLLNRQRELERTPHLMPMPTAGLTLGGGQRVIRTKDGGDSTDY